MNIYALEDHRVKLITLNAGYDSDKEKVEKYLELNNIYTVDYTKVHQSSTDVYLKEFPDISFNSVFFEDVDKQSKTDDKSHIDYSTYNY